MVRRSPNRCRKFAAVAPVILIAPYERHAEVAGMSAAGQIEAVPRAAEWAPLAASLIERIALGGELEGAGSDAAPLAAGGHWRDFSARDQQPADWNAGQRRTVAGAQRPASCCRNAADSHRGRTRLAPTG